LFESGKEAFALGDLDAVQVAAEALQDRDDYRPHANLLEGMVLLRSGRLLEAVQHFSQATAHPDTQALAYGLSGEALYKAKRFRDAQRILLGAVELDPANTDARRWLAALDYDIGMMDHALEQLQAVAEQAPDDPRPARLRGLIYRDFEKYDSVATSAAR
jgi:tetratricopeptide (TPR) repeat protein